MSKVKTKEITESKGYQLIIKDLDSGIEEVNVNVEAIVAGYADAKMAKTGCVGACSANTMLIVCDSVINAANKLKATALELQSKEGVRNEYNN